ncbi:MAG: hypothetical protein FK732_00865, partial [Asgard group archaeon]|nr:hypothetical protein [Asgard group archaeon]
MNLFKKQDQMAKDILRNHRGKVLAIEKATRAGATFSLLKRACELNQKTVIVAPYIEIFKKTVNKVADCFDAENKPKIAQIERNEEICEKVAEKISINQNLSKMPFHFRPTCRG